MTEASCARQRPLHHFVVPLPRFTGEVLKPIGPQPPPLAGEGDPKGGGGAGPA
jgi:hypothetical protein